tara:strand:+ start:398 stop:571 length:174 start_codon:yes stop_codon:yes gene_type:complete
MNYKKENFGVKIPQFGVGRKLPCGDWEYEVKVTFEDNQIVIFKSKENGSSMICRRVI